MRRPLALAASLTLLLAGSTATATVTEPNGLVVPRDSMNGETQIYTMFANLGEPIDWLADAASTPGAFSPLCGFTAKLVLNQTGSHFGIGWYNANGQAPAATDIHIIVPPNSPVGTTITSSDIKNDAAYLGGLIGFALVGGQTHFSETAWDPVCSGCTPPGPWITAVVYASKLTPNAYYIGFEDGSMGATPASFNNDGDYNDYVYFLTGITCSGGGQPCDTGNPGICGAGLTQCTSTGTTCQQLSQPKTETCNGLDDDCNGQIDEGDLCQTGFVCDKGACVQSCQGGEFNCPPTQVCSAAGYCVDPTCKDVVCDTGKVCVGGVCKGPCDGVVCPYPGVCRVGACVDPCSAVTCGQGQVCDAGVCVTACSCAPCATGKACDATSGLCGEPACTGVACGAGTHCAGGTCVDDCTGAVCPVGQACMSGACVDVPSGTGGAGGSSSVGFGVGVGGEGGAGAAMSTSASGSGGHGGHGGSGAGGAGTGSKGTCGCRAAGEEGSAGLGWAGLALAMAAVRRRRAGR